MEFIVIAVLLIVVIAFVAYPLFTTQRGSKIETPNALETLIAQRDSAYDALRDLDFDFQLGKLSQSDYAAMREKYKARAALALQQIDALGGGDSQAAGQIEAQVAKLRRAKTDSVEAEVAQLRASRASTQLKCSECGAPVRSSDQFCAKCGNKLGQRTTAD